jgi:hypothetical protein
MTKTRKTRTIAERKADLIAKLAILEAKENGTYVRENAEKTGLKAVRYALRRRKTELHRAKVLVEGRAATANSPALAGIMDKIENAEQRLAKLREAAEKGENFIANLPFDIDRLEKLVLVGEAGDDVEVPSDLTRLGNEADRTDAEIETKVATSEDSEITENAN